ncbi:MAG: OmpA family protein [Hydrogenobacter thermophilus]|uniref:OmpA family protein n=1 Tax=Hydrogenobacter thermophilus TaxID=940 RepID=UPI001C765853|nr:OmpA family protein [Hydrogenobacter thermophilus]QWK19714.1 MAG: OmpA family protein [Hydrogenobacter thermophilus]
MRKTLMAYLLGLTIAYAQQYNFNIMDGINETLRVVEVAYKSGAEEKDIYHFEKARAYSDVSMFLASEQDGIGSKMFAIKSMNSASKALGGLKGLDSLNLLSHQEFEKLTGLSIAEVNERLMYLRENKGESCAPKELAKAEVAYDALVYEASKEQINQMVLLKLYNDAVNNSLLAKEKLDSAIESKLECYTGKVELPVALKEEPKEQEEKVEKKLPQEEPLMVSARIHFDFDKYSIKREYIPLLNEVVKALKENPHVRVRIEGYTDSIGSKAYNDRLALKRAKAVKDYLVKHGIEESRIDTVGFGKERYIASNETAIGRFTNRRADFIILRLSSQ